MVNQLAQNKVGTVLEFACRFVVIWLEEDISGRTSDHDVFQAGFDTCNGLAIAALYL